MSILQHRYQDDLDRSLHPIEGGAYPRPPSRSQANQRERDRQALQAVISLYLASSPDPGQSSYHQQGAAGPYYQDLEVDLPGAYLEDYLAQAQAQAQAASAKQHRKKVSQDYSSLSGLDGE